MEVQQSKAEVGDDARSGLGKDEVAQVAQVVALVGHFRVEEAPSPVRSVAHSCQFEAVEVEEDISAVPSAGAVTPSPVPSPALSGLSSFCFRLAFPSPSPMYRI